MKAILLAAGLSTRMGRQKLLLPFGGSTVLEVVLDNLNKAGVGNILAVISKEVAEKLDIPFKYANVRTEINYEPERGQSSSLAIGLSMLPKGEDFCIMLGDLPAAAACSIASLASQFKNLPSGKSALTPSRDAVFGHPMFYKALWKDRFSRAEGDTGGKEILAAYENEIVRVPAPDGHFSDMDILEEYERLADEARQL